MGVRLTNRGIIEVRTKLTKNMAKTVLKHRIMTKFRALALILVAFGVVGGATIVHADQFDDQINALRDQNASAQGLLNGLESQAGSYQDTINQLQAQINAVQAQIATNQAQQASLQQQIIEVQAKIDQQKALLTEQLQSMYVDGQMTTIEQLATSKDLSDYVDKQEYQNAVQSKLTDLIGQVTALQTKLKSEKAELDQLVASEQQQNAQLASAQAQQQSMLSYNVAQQNAFNSQISANTGKIAELRRQQAILNAKYNIGDFKGDPGNGGYPSAWANAGQDTLIDSWGMYNRECVSYTAFKVHQDYLAGKNSRDMPYWGGVGNANQWDDNARAAGIAVDDNPTPGSIAISNAGFYGHAMYVEAVNGNQIYVQQYNQQLTGQYSEGWRYSTGLVFLHF
jgi:surface antigen/peptidoglycan hydrolase CwlO-like protein